MHSSFARLSSVFLSFPLLLVTLTGCVNTPFPGGKAPAVLPASPSAEIALMRERSNFWRNFQCKLRIDVNGETAKFSSRAIVLVKYPNLIRFETFTPLGMTAALYVSNEAGPFLLVPSQNTIFTAKRPETVVRRFLGGSLPVDVLSPLLGASIPPERLNTIQSRVRDSTLRLISKSPGGYFEWQVVSNALARVFIGSTEFEGQVTYDPPVRLAEESAPETIRISSKGWSMTVRVEQMRPAVEFQPGVFRLPVLPGVRQVDLDRVK